MQRKAAIKAVHGALPEYILTNKELETMVDTTDEWIKSRTGIEQRHILKDPELAASDLAAEAVKGLFKEYDIDPKSIDMVICATVTGDHSFPDTATVTCDKTGMTNAFGFDLHAACSGFLYALSTGSQFIETGKYQRVLIIGVDIMSSIVDYEDRTTCVLFGDGCGVVLLEPDEENGIEDFVLHGDGSGRNSLHMIAGGSYKPASMETVKAKEHYIYQDGRPVFKRAVTNMPEAVREVMGRNDLTNDDVDWVVPHQANLRIINAVADQLDFPIEKVMINIQKYGNTTAATIPLCLWEYKDQLNKGDKLILTAFGGGFTWGAAYLTWAM